MEIKEAKTIVQSIVDRALFTEMTDQENEALKTLVAFAEEALNKPSVGLQEIRFSIPKDAEDKRRLLIDLENKIGVPLREDRGFFVIAPYFSVGVDEIEKVLGTIEAPIDEGILEYKETSNPAVVVLKNKWSTRIAQALLNEFVIVRRTK